MLSQLARAPDFELPGTDGDREFERYTLSDYTDSGCVVLVFYPFDFSPVCTTELCGFRDAEWLTLTDDIDVFGISRDGCYAHSRFIEEYSLTFPLLSDVEGTVTDAYGIKYDEWELHKGVPKRAVFIVDSDDIVRYTWSTDDAYESPDINELFTQLTEIGSSPIEHDAIS